MTVLLYTFGITIILAIAIQYFLWRDRKKQLKAMNKDSIEEKIDKISTNTNCQVSKAIGNFDMTYEIRNFDYEKYSLKSNDTNFELNGTCEILGGTSEKPSYFSGNTPSQNRYTITCKYPLESLVPKFTIYKNPLFSP